MGLFLSILFIVTSFLSPVAVFGTIGLEYRLELMIGLVTLVASVFSLSDTDFFELKQTYALGVLTVLVLASSVVAGIGRASLGTLELFLTNALIFVFVVINCKKKSHLQILVVCLFFVAVFVIIKGLAATMAGNLESPYIYPQKVPGTDITIARIRGLGEINDPNDFAQLMVALIPCTFFFWGKGKTFQNVLLVYIPCCVLVFGMYLTHSRGGMVALMAAAVVAGRRKIGLLPAAIGGGVVFVALSALGWSGGRDVSASAGSDRMEAWSVGLQLLRTHPLFGVGYQRFTEFYEITAHNMIVVTAAELGLLGFFCWVIFILPTVRTVFLVNQQTETKKQKTEKTDDWERFPHLRAQAARQQQRAVEDGADKDHDRLPVRSARRAASSSAAMEQLTEVPATTSGNPAFPFSPEGDELSVDEVRRLCGVALVSVSGFFAAGWFLSRSYAMTFFLYLGIAVAVGRFSRGRDFAPPAITWGRTIKLGLGVGAALLILVYIMLRLQRFAPG